MNFNPIRPYAELGRQKLLAQPVLNSGAENRIVNRIGDIKTYTKPFALPAPTAEERVARSSDGVGFVEQVFNEMLEKLFVERTTVVVLERQVDLESLLLHDRDPPCENYFPPMQYRWLLPRMYSRPSATAGVAMMPSPILFFANSLNDGSAAKTLTSPSSEHT
jgi:hypothetical protein